MYFKSIIDISAASNRKKGIEKNFRQDHLFLLRQVSIKDRFTVKKRLSFCNEGYFVTSKPTKKTKISQISRG